MEISIYNPRRAQQSLFLFFSYVNRWIPETIESRALGFGSNTTNLPFFLFLNENLISLLIYDLLFV